MICYPNAKINLGLKVLSKRTDGFHNISSFFYPISLHDILEVQIDDKLPCNKVSYSGLQFPNVKDDLVIKAYNLLNSDFELLPVRIHLHKNIPYGSGMGGGSSDATFMLVVLNDLFKLNLTHENLIKYAKLLGSDCPFFLFNTCSHVSGTGDLVHPINYTLKNYYIVIIKPDFICSTSHIFSRLKIKENTSPFFLGDSDLLDLDDLKNDLESVAFSLYPQLKEIRDYFNDLGAVHVSMTGSGSAMYGFFKTKPDVTNCSKHWVWQGKLG